MKSRKRFELDTFFSSIGYFVNFKQGNKMKNTAILTALIMLALTACNKKTSEEPFVPAPVIPPSGSLPPGHPPINTGDQAAISSDTSDVIQSQTATVLSTINIPQFTYLEVKQNNQTRWLATSTSAAKKGDVIQFDNGSTMDNFKSKALNRTFPSITFVNHVTVIKGK